MLTRERLCPAATLILCAVVACLYPYRSSDISATSVFDDCGSSDKEDDASLLQVKVSLHQENLDELAPAITSRDKAQDSHGRVVNKVTEQKLDELKDIPGHAMNELTDDKGFIERYKSSFLQTFTVDRLRSLNRNAGDEQLVKLAGIFIGLAIFACTLILSLSDSDTASGQMARSGSPYLSPGNTKQSLQSSKSAPSSPEVTAAVLSSPPASSTLGTGSLAGGLVLCPEFVVPARTQLACLVRSDVRGEKQTSSFEVRSANSGTAFCRVSISELSTGQKPGIFLQTVDGGETLCSVSTEELWDIPPSVRQQAMIHKQTLRPALSLSRQPSGVLYGSVQKNTSGGYDVLRGQSSVMSLTGDFVNHDVKVTSNRRLGATVTPLTPQEYRVHGLAGVDFGLLLLAICAAEKLERFSLQPLGVSMQSSDGDKGGPRGLPLWNQAKVIVWSKVTIELLTKNPENKQQIFDERWAKSVENFTPESRQQMVQYFHEKFGVYPRPTQQPMVRPTGPIRAPDRAFTGRPASAWVDRLTWK